MGGDYLDLPVLERERLVFFIVQIELAHSEKQLVWIDAEKKGVQFFLGSTAHGLTSQRSGLQLWPSFH